MGLSKAHIFISLQADISLVVMFIGIEELIDSIFKVAVSSVRKLPDYIADRTSVHFPLKWCHLASMYLCMSQCTRLLLAMKVTRITNANKSSSYKYLSVVGNSEDFTSIYLTAALKWDNPFAFGFYCDINPCRLMGIKTLPFNSDTNIILYD